MLGYSIGRKVKIGFSIIMVNNITMMSNSKIGHFNLVKVDTLEMGENAGIGLLNIIRGPFDVKLRKRAAIGKNCLIRRGKVGTVTVGKSELILGELSKLTANHFIDMTRSIIFGDFSTLAGIRSQLWTHGYVHAPEGPDRFRVDGEITIGSNVYIGSGVIINPGVYISDTINIGGGAVVSKSLHEKGMYVAQALRHLDKGYEDIKAKLKKVEEDNLLDEVYEK